MNNYEKVADWIVNKSDSAYDEVLSLLEIVCDEVEGYNINEFYQDVINTYDKPVIKTYQKVQKSKTL